MVNPFKVIADMAETIVETCEENENLRRENLFKRRLEREEKKAKKIEKEHELWREATKEELKNPDEWRVLPYGWSPFGIRL